MNEFVKLCLNREGSLTIDEQCDGISFYAINPKFSPIPPDMDMICVVNSSTGNTISISNLYDVFNVDKNCIKFLAWLEPIENTIPLYIYQKDENSIYIDFKPNDIYKPLYFSPIHVFKDINYKFKYFRGRCIPDKSEGFSSLNDCMKKIISCNKDKPTILNLIQQRYENFKYNNNIRFVYVLCVILIIFCLYIIYYIIIHIKLFNVAKNRLR